MPWLFIVFVSSATPLSAAASPPPPKPPPVDADCPALPNITFPLSFSSGELLEFDIDALGAQAGKMTLRTLPPQRGTLPIEVRVNTNTFFSKVRKVRSVVQSNLLPQTLLPVRYNEETFENEVPHRAQVQFQKNRTMSLKYSVAERTGETVYHFGNTGLDLAGAIYLFRQLPLAENMPLCFDIYGVHRLWRVVGKVVGKETVSAPVGDFEAWHLAGEAIRQDDHRKRREIHVWISADARRLPLAALGAIDLGAVRATLSGFQRPGDKKIRAQGKESLTW